MEILGQDSLPADAYGPAAPERFQRQRAGEPGQQAKRSFYRFTQAVSAARCCRPSSAAEAPRESLTSDRLGLLGSSPSEARMLLEHAQLQRNHGVKAEKPSELTFPIEAAL